MKPQEGRWGKPREASAVPAYTQRSRGYPPPPLVSEYTLINSTLAPRERNFTLYSSLAQSSLHHILYFFSSLYSSFFPCLSLARARAFFPIFTRVPNAHSRKNARAFTKPRHLQTLMQYSAQSQRENVRGYSTMACTQCALAALP